MADTLEISTDRARMDVSMIHGFLSGAYWAKGRSRSTVERSLDHSLCFGAFVDGAQVGFARVISDFAVFAYIADVFVLPSHRGRRISRALMESILSHPELAGLRLFWLGTKDAHGLYEKFGFTRLSDPGKYMALFGPEPAPFAPAPEGDASG